MNGETSVPTPIIESKFSWYRIYSDGLLKAIDWNSYSTREEAIGALVFYLKDGSYLSDELVLIESFSCKNSLEIYEHLYNN